ncbi:MAG: hypothetical protein LBU32_07760 [Clostridiales bacterium]|jgi:uncharacterized protein YigA (DUF484 family)|nr:hypothetical protein [Clostridiales bacterium]
MDDFLLHLKILERILREKREILEQILAISENQAVVLESYQDDFARAMHSGMSKEKQKLIDIALKNDGVFETVFNEIVDVFEQEAPGCKRVVEKLQEHIKAVASTDALIRSQEAKNSELARRKSPVYS